MGIAAILVTALPVLLLRGMSRPVARGTEEYREALERANQSVATGLHNLEAIKASGREEAFLGEYGEKLAEAARAFCRNVSVAQTCGEAIAAAMKDMARDDALIVCGSFYLASEIREQLKGKLENLQT